MSCRESNDTNLKLQYIRHCKILTNDIKTAKKKNDDKLISKSNNKTKTAGETNKKEIEITTVQMIFNPKN